MSIQSPPDELAVTIDTLRTSFRVLSLSRPSPPIPPSKWLPNESHHPRIQPDHRRTARHRRHRHRSHSGRVGPGGARLLPGLAYYYARITIRFARRPGQGRSICAASSGVAVSWPVSRTLPSRSRVQSPGIARAHRQAGGRGQRPSPCSTSCATPSPAEPTSTTASTLVPN